MEERLEPDVPLPAGMQGRWIEMDHPDAELVIEGGKITCFGETVGYDYKLVETIDGALVVSLKVNDPAAEDAFQRANVTGLFLTPDGEFHAYNVKFASRFVRPE